MDIDNILNDSTITSNIGKLVKYEITTKVEAGEYTPATTTIRKGVGVFEGINSKVVVSDSLVDPERNEVAHFKFGNLNVSCTVRLNEIASISITAIEAPVS